MNDLFERQKAKERQQEALRYAAEPKSLPRKYYKFSAKEIEPLLELLLPQPFNDVTSAIRTALYQIDPSWQMGQFKIFNDHFRIQLLRSFFVRRYSFSDIIPQVWTEQQLLAKILQASHAFEDTKKAAFAGKLLSEYVLRCPKDNIPSWADTYKYFPNWLFVFNVHAYLWQMFYW